MPLRQNPNLDRLLATIDEDISKLNKSMRLLPAQDPRTAFFIEETVRLIKNMNAIVAELVSYVGDNASRLSAVERMTPPDPITGD